VSPLSRLPKLIEDARASGLRVEQNINLAHSLTAEQESAVYRILQEAITNVIRHAEASTLKLTVETSEGMLTLQVDDDGVGLGKSAPGNGMSGMRERLTAIAGELEFIDREPGLSVRAQLPLSNNQPSKEKAID